MNIDSSIPPSIPFHVARAYRAAGSGGGVGAVEPVSNRLITTPVQPVARVGADQQSGQSSPTAQRLVAGVVPGGVDFSADEARPTSSAALAFYRHPTDKNSAATDVQVGRSIDVSG